MSDCRNRGSARRFTWTPRRIRLLSKRLSMIYSNPRHYNKDKVIDELIFIVLSSKTAEKSYIETYDTLKMSFPNWRSLLKAPSRDVLEILRSGGLSKKKEMWIRQILQKTVQDSFGQGQSFFTNMSTEDAESYLKSLPGIGLKSARCVLMYTMERDVFPVDSHCNRILVRLGMIERRRLTDRAQDEIQERIPTEVRYSMHVNLVAHGRAICRSRHPKCEQCGVRDMCSWKPI